MGPGSSARLRLAELLAPLSYVTDLGMGEPEGQALRSTLLCVRLGELLGLGQAELSDCYYTTMLRHIGCTATAHEESGHLVPDEIAARGFLSKADVARGGELLALTRNLLGQVPIQAKPKLLANLLRPRLGRVIERSLCEVAAMTAQRLGLGPGVERGLYEARERWDGKGQPDRLQGNAITLPARLAPACTLFASLSSALGAEAACALIAERGGGWLDPAVAEPLAHEGAKLLAEIEAVDLLEAVVDMEPGFPKMVLPEGIDAVARVFADLADLKTPWTHGHSTAVAEIAERAAALSGLPPDERATIRLAGLLHDLGRVAVPNSIWDKPAALNSLEWERVRLHAYHSERILSRCAVFASAARLAGMHHERLDGSGYHRQAAGLAIPTGARILAAADAYQAMTQDRPYRPAWTPETAAAELTRMGAAGSLDPEAVRAVLHAVAPAAIPRRMAWPAGLSDREVEVLRLVAKGLSNRAIGAALHISPRTAEHHVQSLYVKIGHSTRAAAAMFAMEHGLLRPDA